MHINDICDITNSLAVASSIIRFTTVTDATRHAHCSCNGSRLRVTVNARVLYGRAFVAARVERLHNNSGDPFSPSWAEDNTNTILTETLWTGTYDAFHTGALDVPSFIAKIEEACNAEAAIAEDASDEPEADVSLDAWRDKEHENAE